MRLTAKLFTFAMVIFIAGILCAQVTEVSAKPLTDDDISMLRKDIQKEKNQLITELMQFSKPEADAFWPIYKEYSAEQATLNQSRLRILTEYAQAMDKLDTAKAHELTVRSFKFDEDSLALKRKYLPEFEKALGGKRAAKFFQIDNRMTAILNLQLASEVPLIQ